MAKHMLDWGTTKCSCKWWGCKICGASNKIISFHNDLMKFGLSKETITSKLSEINGYLWKIDTYTLYEYYSGAIDEEKFNEALENYKPHRKVHVSKTAYQEVVDTTWRVNPKKACVYKGSSPWDRCIYCNSIRRYMEWKECPKYKETPGTTDAENK